MATIAGFYAIIYSMSRSKITKEYCTYDFRLPDGTTLSVPYTLCRSSRRTYSLQISAEGELSVHVPRRMPMCQVNAVLEERTSWILTNIRRQLEKAKNKPVSNLTDQERQHEIRYISKQLKPLILDRISKYEPLLPAWHRPITSVAIRNQKTRWGSCSSKGTLSFNWKLYLAPIEVLDYVVVHELCHLCEMNHSAAFWGLVEQIMPDYRERMKWLKQNGNTLEI